MTILEALRSTPTTKKALAERMGCDTRTVETEVQAARLRGVPICSDDRGYWFAQTPAEVRECADRLRRRYINQALTARALRRAAARMERRGEPTLWDAA